MMYERSRMRDTSADDCSVFTGHFCGVWYDWCQILQRAHLATVVFRRAVTVRWRLVSTHGSVNCSCGLSQGTEQRAWFTVLHAHPSQRHHSTLSADDQRLFDRAPATCAKQSSTATMPFAGSSRMDCFVTLLRLKQSCLVYQSSGTVSDDSFSPVPCSIRVRFFANCISNSFTR